MILPVVDGNVIQVLQYERVAAGNSARHDTGEKKAQFFKIFRHHFGDLGIFLPVLQGTVPGDFIVADCHHSRIQAAACVQRVNFFREIDIFSGL